MQAARIRDGLSLLAVVLLPWQARFIRSLGTLGDAPWEAATRGFFATELLILAALTAHFFSVSSGQRKPMSTPAWLRFWTLLLVFALISIAWAPRPEAALGGWTHLFEGFALAYLIRVSDRPLRQYVVALVLGGVLNALLAVWQFLTQTSFASTLLGISAHPASQPGVSVVETGIGRHLRAYGLSPHPNVLGGHVAFALLGAGWLYLDGVKGKLRPTLLGAIGLLALALAFSFSRAAWLGYAVVALVGLLARYRRMPEDVRERVKHVVLAHAAVAVLVFAVSAPIVATRLGSGTRLERMSIDQRAVAAYRSAELLKTHYAAGVGIGNMPAAAYEELRPRGNAYGYEPAHHVGLLVAVELGFFGFMMLLGAVVVWFGDAIRLFRRSTRPLIRGAALMPLLFVIIGFFDHYPFSLYAGTMLVGAAFGLYLKGADGES